MGVLGTSVPRKEDRRLLVGGGRYVGDLVLPGMVHVVLVRSPAQSVREQTGFQGASELVWVSAAGGAPTLIAPAAAVSLA